MAGDSGNRWPLVGRGDELALLDEEVGARSGCVVLAGPAGVGKSRMLATWAARWEASGGSAVVVRATRSTATIPFGAFAPWVPARLSGAGDRLAILHATAAQLTGPGVEHSGGRRLIAIDDAHLLDEGSAALVLHLVEHTELAALLTVREGEPCPDAIVALWKESVAQRLDLAPLSEGETAELLTQVLGESVARAAQRRVWQLTDGNPLYIREVVAAARAQGVLVRATKSDGMWHWQGHLTGRTRLVELVSGRVGGGDAAQRRVLELVALGEPLPVDVLARLAPGPLLAEIESRGLLTVERSTRGEDQVVRLPHPLYTEVLRAELPAFTARAHYAALTEAAVAVAMDARDPVRVATWMLESGDGHAAPELLLRASLRARVVDDYGLSLRFAEAAERAGGGWRATLRRAVALGPMGRLDEADALLSSLSQPGTDPEARVAAAEVRAEQSFWYRGEGLRAALSIVEETVAAVPAPVGSLLLSYGGQLALSALDIDEAVRLSTRAYNDAGSPRARLHAVLTAGLAAAFRGCTRLAMAASRLGRPGSVEVMDQDPVPALYVAYVYSLMAPLDGRIDEAAAVFQEMVNQRFGYDRGASPALLKYWAGRAVLDQGRVGTAARLCREALESHGDENPYGRGTWIAGTLALAAAQAGDADSAAMALAWNDARRQPQTDIPGEHFAELARAWLHAARGELSAARCTALTAARRAARAGAATLEMLALLQAARLGAPEAAAPRLEELAGIVCGPYAPAAARFARAAADGDGHGLDAAAEQFASQGARLVAAEAATAAAEAHAAQGQRRRHAESRARAQELAASCEGAVTPWLVRLDQAPLVTMLTAREREVAELAARGRTSREIAQALGVSMRTVHSHLNHAYTKLGTSDRTTLAVALAVAGRG